MTVDLDLHHHAPPPKKKDHRIGAIGAGFIMRDCHLVAYRNAGYHVVAITSQPPEQAREVARLRGVPTVYNTNEELIADPSIEVLDIAVPPNFELPIVREAVKHAGHIKGILAQKPLGTNYQEAKEIVRLSREAGITLGVNQNMRYDQSIRALKTRTVTDIVTRDSHRWHWPVAFALSGLERLVELGDVTPRDAERMRARIHALRTGDAWMVTPAVVEVIGRKPLKGYSR